MRLLFHQHRDSPKAIDKVNPKRFILVVSAMLKTITRGRNSWNRLSAMVISRLPPASELRFQLERGKDHEAVLVSTGFDFVPMMMFHTQVTVLKPLF